MTLRNILIAAALAGGLSACANAIDVLDQGRPYAAETAKELVLAECALPLYLRKANADAVAGKLLDAGSPATFLLDCDGDGLSDFPPQQ